MFFPTFIDPWRGSTYVRVPRSGPFPAPGYEEPFVAYTPRHDPLTTLAANSYCTCPSCARASAAASADDLSVRPQPRVNTQQSYHPWAHHHHHQHAAQQYPQQYHRQSPAYVKAHVPSYGDVCDEDYGDAQGLQQYQTVQYAEPSYPHYPRVSISSSRPASSYAGPASSPSVQPDPVATLCQSGPSPSNAWAADHGPAAAQHWRQQQSVPASTPPTPSSRARHQVKVQQASHHSLTAEPVAVHNQQQQQPVISMQPIRQLSRSEAATIIQSWWRMRRLARQQPALKALAAAAAQLHSTTARFGQYKADSTAGSNSSISGRPAAHLSHKQYLELNELAMRVLLQLDATPCGVPELRAVRKRLTAAAIKMLDEVQGAYSAAVHCSMEVSDDVVRAALHDISKTADTERAAGEAGPAGGGQEGQQQDHIGHQESQQQPWQQQTGVAAAAPSKAAAIAHLSPAEITASDLSKPTDDGYDCEQHHHQQHNAQDAEVVLGQQQQQQLDGCDTPAPVVAPRCAWTSVLSDVPPDVRVVFVYPGSRTDAAAQTD